MGYTLTIYRKAAPLILAAALFALLACDDGVVGPEPPYNSELDFYQLNFDLEGNVITDSAWGSVDLTYDGSSGVLYFNLAVDGTWVIKNVSVLSFTPGVSQTLTFTFDLGVEDGTDVTQLEYAFDLTTSLSATAPTEYSTASVTDRNVVAYSGGIGDLDVGRYTVLEDVKWPGDPPTEWGGEVIGDNWAVRDGACKDYQGNNPKYNQDCKENECIPAAVSNSLSWLKDKHGLDYPGDGDPDIEEMKTATGWRKGTKETGAPLFDHDNEEFGPVVAWQKAKDAYLQYHKYGITTTWQPMRNLSTPANREAACDGIVQAIKDDKDVEINSGWHVGMVVAAAKVRLDALTFFVFYVAHDTNQGNNGGTQVDKVFYFPEEDVFEGSPGWFNGGTMFKNKELGAQDTYGPIVIEEPSP